MVHFTPEQELIITEQYLNLPISKIAKELGVYPNNIRTRLKRLGLVIPKEVSKRHQGYELNKVGHEIINADGYIEVKEISGEYVLKHRKEWEQKNDAILPNQVLKCLDGNKQNTDPSNWKLIDRYELLLTNNKEHKELIPTLLLINKLKQHGSKSRSKNRD